MGEIYAGLARIRDRYGDLVRAQFPKIPRRVSGYNLDFLLPENGFNVARALVGSEGTCVTILEATARLVPSPPCRSLLVLGFADIYLAADAIGEVTDAGPIGLEGVDELLVRHSRKKNLNAKGLALLPDGQGWLYVEFGARHRGRGRGAGLAADASGSNRARARRRCGSSAIPPRPSTSGPCGSRPSGATSFVPGEAKNWEGWEDAAVPPARLGEYLRRLRQLMGEYRYTGSLYGHFGQGCVHTRINFDLKTAGGIAAYRRFVEEAADLVVELGGSISGEHGDGQSRGELLPRMYGEELMQAFREFKGVWDPAEQDEPRQAHRALPPRRAPPRAAVPPGGGAHALRVSQWRAAWPTRPCGAWAWGSAARRTAEPCVRPTWPRATSGTRRAAAPGCCSRCCRARSSRRASAAKSVKEALDLCLSCKSCKSECPTGVDMAAYKAEFLAHYYEGRRRPLRSYAFGLINHWGAMAEYAPAPGQFLHDGGRRSARSSNGRSTSRPSAGCRRFAPRSFRRSFRAESRIPNPAIPQSPIPSVVLLWPDCSNNYFHPEVAHAAVAVLEHAGFAVDIPRDRLCCGRPLYDHGMLTAAKRRLTEILDSLRGEIEAGTPIVGLEPSCISVFRDELIRFFPDDPLARKLSQQALFLTEFLVKTGTVPSLGMPGRAVVHPHCHERASLCLDDDLAVLKATGLELTVLDAGCCGMAGAFGFERDHFEVSRAVGERVLLPAVREAAARCLHRDQRFQLPRADHAAHRPTRVARGRIDGARDRAAPLSRDSGTGAVE